MVGRLSLQPVAGERFEAATRRSHESLLLLDSPDSGLPPSPSHPLEPAAAPPARRLGRRRGSRGDWRSGLPLPYVTLCGGFGGPGGTGAPRLVPSDYSEGVCVQAGPRATSTRCCSEVRFACGRRYRDGVECEPALAVASCRQTVVARPSTTRRSFTSELRLEPRQRERRHTATAFAFPRHARHLFRTTVTSGGDAAAVASGASSAAPAARGAGTRYTSCVRLQSLAPPSVGIVYREDGRAGT
ncbi:unnamed protein product [Lampetra planeri]